MTDVSGIHGIQQNTAPDTADNTRGNQEIDKDLFLQMLVTQLRHQDPLSEDQDMGEFITQLTMFTLVEQITKMQESLEEQKVASDGAMVLGLLNREVVIQDETGGVVEGVVSSVDFSGQQPRVTVDGHEYPFSSVIKVEGGDEEDGG